VRVVLPDESFLTVPDGLDAIGALKDHIETQTGVPVSAQCLLVPSGEDGGVRELTAIQAGADIDLVIATGTSYCICRAGLREHMADMFAEAFVPADSRLASRDLAAFSAEPAGHFAPVDFSPPPPQGEAGTYLAAFDRDRAARVRKLARTRAQLQDGPVVVSTFNWGFRHILENWVASCDRNAIDCRIFTLLFPADRDADLFAKRLGLRTYFDGESYGALPVEAAEEFGDDSFRRMMFAKIAMTVDMLDAGGDFIRQDVDLVWTRDPRAELADHARRSGLDMLFMYDGPNRVHQPLYYNTGFVFIRSNPFTRHVWKTVLANYGHVLAEGGEQRLINTVMSFFQARGLHTARLDETAYMNGHVISRVLDHGGELPRGSAVVHASWTKNMDAKIAHMKRFGFWYLY
jgi:hypothetical protein